MTSILAALLGFLARVWSALRRSEGERLGRAEERASRERARADAARASETAARDMGGVLAGLERARSAREEAPRAGDDLFGG